MQHSSTANISTIDVVADLVGVPSVLLMNDEMLRAARPCPHCPALDELDHDDRCPTQRRTPTR
jgi:hypothetical protein